ncbi:uncharacterized protein LOC105384488 [Plutella xylostella]|uniref:uncharacterized protein LOC105384488 n=1 Tax=Plutella xylostella TaxID=51655 RepID=UPI002032AB52|nr:uncharacterized protein LOC105384488 [Plutella xylostella]
MKYLLLLMFLATSSSSSSSAYEISELRVPLLADPRRAAELSCHFNMDQHRLHSVKWYRDMDEIFRYNPQQTPSIRLFNVSGVMVLGGSCQAARCEVAVRPAPVAARALYTCETSTEGPKFLIARETKAMTVAAMPTLDPVISGAPGAARAGEQLLLNCSADYSLPPADIRWYIDDQLQKSDGWERSGLSAPSEGGLRASWRALRLSAAAARGALRVRCEAELPLQPPVRRDATATILVHTGTYPDKYVAGRGVTSIVNKAMFVIVIFWTFLKTSIFTSL